MLHRIITDLGNVIAGEEAYVVRIGFLAFWPGIPGDRGFLAIEKAV